MAFMKKKKMNQIKEWIIESIIFSPIFMMVLCFFGIQNYINIWYILFALAGLCSWIISIWEWMKGKQKYKVRYLILVAIIWILFSVLCSGYPLKAFIGGKYRHSCGLTYILLMGIFLNSMTLSKESIKRLGKNLLIVSTIMCIISLLNNELTRTVFMNDYLSNTMRLKYPYHGVFYNANHYAYYLTIILFITILYFFKETRVLEKSLYLIIYYLHVYLLIINNTFGSYIAVCIGIILLIGLCWKKIKKRDIIIILILFLINSVMLQTQGKYIVRENFKIFQKDIKETINRTQKTAGTGRVTLWKRYIRIIKKSPIIGYGGENIDGNKVKLSQLDAPHNSLIELATYNGIPLTIIYLLFLSMLFLEYIKKRKNKFIELDILLIIICSYFISSFFGVIIFYTSEYYAIILGVFYKLLKENAKTGEVQNE